MLKDKEVGVVNRDLGIRARSQAQRFYFGVSVVKLGGKIRVRSDDAQRGRLSPGARSGKGNQQNSDG